MPGKTIRLNDHEFEFTLSPTRNGGWTMCVLHTDRSGPSPNETKSMIDIEFESEAQAMDYADRVAIEMARRRDASRAGSLKSGTPLSILSRQ
ncbi:hypothetical protein [Paraburkholderia tropica]|uniref:hypothetical protein n=1 Tax=Paraburkholderia tropica TaxID=92647 RepID=UPI002AB7B9E2|nr:hypothetical protein [Paraburkholderia tropica]